MNPERRKHKRIRPPKGTVAAWKSAGLADISRVQDRGQDRAKFNQFCAADDRRSRSLRDAHNAGISGIYFTFPQPFGAIVDFFEPVATSGRVQFGQLILFGFSNLHFGRFGWFAEALWAALGLVPAILAFTGIFMCCHRLFVRKGASFRQR